VLTLAGFLAAFLLGVGYLLYQAGTLPTFGKKYTLTAEVPTGNFLASGARVTVAGAEVGRVKSVDRAGSLSPNATVKLEITDDRVFPLPDDSRVQIRTRSQVGENYVNIVVGKSKVTVPNNGSLGLDNADEFVSVDQILSVLRGRTKARARVLLQQLGAGLDGRGLDLQHTLGPGARFRRLRHAGADRDRAGPRPARPARRPARARDRGDRRAQRRDHRRGAPGHGQPPGDRLARHEGHRAPARAAVDAQPGARDHGSDRRRLRPRRAGRFKPGRRDARAASGGPLCCAPPRATAARSSRA